MDAEVTQLHEAVERGDLAGARELLAKHPKIFDEARGEMRPIHMALVRRDVEMVKLLLEHGADTECGIWPNRDATGPYVMARERGYDEIFDAIRGAREKRGARGVPGPTEEKRKLHQAFLSGNEDAAVAVFDQHPELAETCPPDGVSLFHQMAGHGAMKVLKWMIDHGADVNKKSVKGMSPLDFAVERGASNLNAVADFLIDQGAHLSPKSAAALGRWDYFERCRKEDLEQTGALEAAVRHNRADVLEKLLAMGLDPDERMQVDFNNYNDWTQGGPLYHAVVEERGEMARMLLARGANPNASVWCSGSPTYKAFEANNAEMIALMQEHGGWVDAGSAGYARQTEIARRMLAGEMESHIEPNGFSGQTVAEQLLWGGASSKTPEIVKMALEQVDWAREDPRWFGMLWRPLAGAEDPLASEAIECFRMILERSGPHHVGDTYKQTMLHEIMSCNAHPEMATMLLDAGARMDVRDVLLNSTPLGWACRWGRVELVRLLLARGADALEKDAEAWATPRAWAEKMHRPEILALLPATS